MSTVRVLKIGFKTALEENGTFSVKYVKDPNGSGSDKLTDAAVQTFCGVLLSNSTLFKKAPVSIESAEVVTTITDEVDVSGVNGGGGD